MEITLIGKRLYNKLVKIQQQYPNLTYQNKNYDNVDKSKFTEKDWEMFKFVENTLKTHILYFCSFNHFKLRPDGTVVVRFQYNWGGNGNGASFIGVGYLKLTELLNGFDKPVEIIKTKKGKLL